MSEESPNTRISPQTQPSLHEQIADAVRTVRETTPLAQSFTNFVTINLVANAQLAAGGAAAMSFLPDDIIDTATISGADYINVGTLLPFYKDALPQVARAFHNTGHPWVLDPVAAGIGETRTAILQSFKRYPPTVIRGNASEIIALDAMWGLNEESATATASKPPAWNPSTTWNPPSHRRSGSHGSWRGTAPTARRRWPSPVRRTW